MLKDLKFEFKNDDNSFTRIIKINFNDIIDNNIYLKQVYDVLAVNYDGLIISNPFTNELSLRSYLKNFNSDVEFHFTFQKNKFRDSKVVIIAI